MKEDNPIYEPIFEYADIPKPVLPLNLFYDGLSQELAIHEASHVVFSSLLVKNFKKFHTIKYAISCAENVKLNGWNIVNGVSPLGYTKEQCKSRSLMKKFYSQNQEMIIGRIFSSLAGYLSYQVYIKDTEKFVSTIDIKTETISYSTFRYKYLSEWTNSDFQNVKAYFGYMGTWDAKTSFLKAKIVLEGLRELMEIQAVRDSIIYVSRKLIKLECKRLEGAELNEVIRGILRLTNKVPYSDYCKKYLQLVQ